MLEKYNFKESENKWQEFWQKSGIYKVYSELLGRINSKVQAMRKSLAFVPIIFNGDNVEIDYKSIPLLIQ